MTNKCEKWVHMKWVQMGSHAKSYDLLKLNQSDWFCMKCLGEELPFTNSETAGGRNISLREIPLQKVFQLP